MIFLLSSATKCPELLNFEGFLYDLGLASEESCIESEVDVIYLIPRNPAFTMLMQTSHGGGKVFPEQLQQLYNGSNIGLGRENDSNTGEFEGLLL